jgi:SAM-dependent methyltransferase
MKSAFYTQDDIASYDSTIDLVVPLYALFHETVISLIRNCAPESGNFSVLDVGAGSGAEAIAILKSIPTASVVALDLSEAMHERFRRNAVESLGFDPEDSGRCQWLTVDFLADDLANILASNGAPSGDTFDLIVSGFTFHHFTNEQKKYAYARCYEILSPGGCLINLDLFTYAAASVAATAKNFDHNWISTQFRNPDPSFLPGLTIPKIEEASNIDQARREELRSKWLLHHEEDNLLEPFEVQSRYLSELGFVECECPMRFWHTGILYARKPGDSN